MILGILLTAILGVPIGTTLTFTWEPPTTNVDGSPLTDLRQYRMYEKIDSGPWVGRMGISNKVCKMTSEPTTPGACKITYRPTTTGVHKFKLTAINMAKKESSPSNEVEIVIDRPVPQTSASPTPTIIP